MKHLLLLSIICLFTGSALPAESLIFVSWGNPVITKSGEIKSQLPPEELFSRCGIRRHSFAQIQNLSGIDKVSLFKANDKYGNLDIITLSQLNCALQYQNSGYLSPRDSSEKALRIVAKVLASGVQKIGRLSVNELQSQLSRLQFNAFQWGHLLDANANRGAGLNLENVVIMGNRIWQALKEADYSGAFVLHEALGAIGIDDNEYQYSSALWWISRNPKRANQIKDSLEIALHLKSRRSPSGTGSVVGGGGDPSELYFKLSFLYNIPMVINEFRNNPMTDPRLKRLTMGDFEITIFKTKVRTNIFDFLIYNLRSQKEIAEIFPGVKTGDRLALIPHNWIYGRQSDHPNCFQMIKSPDEAGTPSEKIPRNDPCYLIKSIAKMINMVTPQMVEIKERGEQF